MRGLIPPIFNKIVRKAAILKQFSQKKSFLKSIAPGSPLLGIPVKLVGDSSGDPREFFDHYSAYAFWATQKIESKAETSGRKLRILDVGSPKMINSIISVRHNVNAIVLANCQDSISDINYVYHDICEMLPFPDSSFDIFTSTVSLPLVGLARYGDKLDANCLPNFVNELNRVMSPGADLLISMCLGPNLLAFNNGWFLDIETIQSIFKGWTLVDKLVDNWSSPYGTRKNYLENRFTADTDIKDIPSGDYRVVFLHFKNEPIKTA